MKQNAALIDPVIVADAQAWLDANRDRLNHIIERTHIKMEKWYEEQRKRDLRAWQDPRPDMQQRRV